MSRKNIFFTGIVSQTACIVTQEYAAQRHSQNTEKLRTPKSGLGPV